MSEATKDYGVTVRQADVAALLEAHGIPERMMSRIMSLIAAGEHFAYLNSLIAEFPEGARVRTNTEIDLFDDGTIPCGLTGTVMRRPAGCEPSSDLLFHVRLDAPLACLAPWGNKVQVTDPAIGMGATVTQFDVIKGEG